MSKKATKASPSEQSQGGTTQIPRAFISYSRSSPDYTNRVEELGRRLTEHGVHVVLDLWDLEEGQDLHAFMEQAVNDTTISHVLILCDPQYAEKANNRERGGRWSGELHCL
jgi:hypothetical protein